MYCPLISFQKQYQNEILCMGEDCVLSDKKGNCLIKQALMKYICNGRNEEYIANSYTHNITRMPFDEFDDCEIPF